MLIVEKKKDSFLKSVINFTLGVFIGLFALYLANFGEFTTYLKQTEANAMEAYTHYYKAKEAAVSGDEEQLVNSLEAMGKVEGKISSVLALAQMDEIYRSNFYRAKKYDKPEFKEAWPIDTSKAKISKKTMDKIISMHLADIDKKIEFSHVNKVLSKCSPYNYVCKFIGSMLMESAASTDKRFSRSQNIYKYNYEHLSEYDKYLDEIFNLAQKKQDFVIVKSPGALAYPDKSEAVK